MDDGTILESQSRKFSSITEECAHWKRLCHEYAGKLKEAKQDNSDFVESSKELEAELEATLEQREKTIRDLKHSLNQIQNDNESIRVRKVTANRHSFPERSDKLLFAEKNLEFRNRLQPIGCDAYAAEQRP